MGKILRVDLSKDQVSEIETEKYVSQFIGGYGMALKLMWDELAGNYPKRI
ncbi:MAG: aldehyde ferredoxin oxidoreductase N-terminal domain-containing protein [Nitrososphaeria archaeon]